MYVRSAQVQLLHCIRITLLTTHAPVLQQEQYAQQPGFFDRAKAYVPSLHSSGYSQQTEEVAATPHQSQYSAPTSTTQTDHDEAQPSLLDKAKAYIPVLGSSTDFDPATEARMNQEDRLYQEVPEGDTGFEPEDSHHESLLDKAKAYMPAMGAPGTTTAGIDVSPSPALHLLGCCTCMHSICTPGYVSSGALQLHCARQRCGSNALDLCLATA